MPVRVHVPRALRAATGGASTVTVELPAATRATLADLVDALGRGHPGIWHRLVDERGRLREGINVLVDARRANESGGLLTPVDAESEVWILAGR